MAERRARAVLFAVAASAFGAAAGAYQVYFAPDFLNDHFMHVAWARQMLAGEWPVRDFFEPGMPLADLTSALAEWLVGYRLLSEALVVGIAVGAGVAVTTWVTARLTDSLPSGLFAGFVVAFTFVRSYSYPKVALYAIAVCLGVGYARAPGRGRLIGLAALAGIGFWYRHDHGAVIGLATLVLLALVHARSALAPARTFALVASGIALPYVLYAMITGGPAAYWRSSMAFVSGEAKKTSPLTVPAWPLRGTEDWVMAGREPFRLGIRWVDGVTDGDRAAAESALGLRAVERDGRAGRYLLDDPTSAKLRAVMTHPSIDDTSGINRLTGEADGLWTRVSMSVPRPPVRLLTGVATAPEAAAALFYVLLAAPLALIVINALRRTYEWPIVGFLVALCSLTALAFLRNPLEARIGDAAVAPAVALGLVIAALSARCRVPGTGARRAASWAGRLAIAVLLVLIAWPVVVVGHVGRRLDVMSGRGDQLRAQREWQERWEQLTVTPPLRGVSQGSDRAPILISRYIDACTPPDSRVFVSTFAPDIYYFANRRFAGRTAFILAGFWATEREQTIIARALKEQQPAVVVTDDGMAPAGFDIVAAALAERYVEAGQLRDEGRTLRVLVPRDAVALSAYGPNRWPCYRPDASTQ